MEIFILLSISGSKQLRMNYAIFEIKPGYSFIKTQTECLRMNATNVCVFSLESNVELHNLTCRNKDKTNVKLIHKKKTMQLFRIK